MPLITNWTAKRAGAAITITGKLDGADFRLPGVTAIDRTGSGVIARHPTGDVELA